MTNVIELAKRAGCVPEDGQSGFWVAQTEDLERFAKLVRNAYQAELLAGRKGPVCRLWVEPETCNYIVDRCDHPPSETIDVYTADQLAAAVLAARNAALDEAAQKCEQDYRVQEARRAHADSMTLGGANHAYFNEVLARLTVTADAIRNLKEST